MSLFYVSVTFSVDKRAAASYRSYYNTNSMPRGQYTYKAPIQLEPGDLVVVDTPAHGFTVAQVQSCWPESAAYAPGAYKWIAGIVETDLLRSARDEERAEQLAREEAKAAKAEIRKNIRRLQTEKVRREAEARKQLELRLMHEVDPTLPELDRQIDALKAQL